MPEAFGGQFSKKGEEAVCILRKELYIKRTSGGEIAQLVEQRTENPRVPGSIPGLATIFCAIKAQKHEACQGFASCFAAVAKRFMRRKPRFMARSAASYGFPLRLDR